MKKVLVTGATGFVGSALLQRLGISGQALSLRNKPANGLAWLDRADSVVHLAARVHIMNDAVKDPLAEFRASNLDLTVDLAQQAARAGVRRFVFISSVKVNGEETAPGTAYTAADVPLPQDPYGVSKMEAEQALARISAQTGLEVVVIRPPLVYGPGVRANFGALLNAVARGIPLPLGGIHNRRSLVALDNLVDLIVTCIHHPKAAGQVWMVSDGDDLSTPDLIRRMARVMGRPPRLIDVPVGILEKIGILTGKSHAMQRLCSNLQVDISETKAVLGWQPPISVDEGLRRTALQWRKQ